MKHNRGKSARLIVASTIAAAGILVAVTSAASSNSALVTRGDLSPFAAGAAGTVHGRAEMVRDGSGSTKVSLHVEGLVPGRQYASHVHAASCAVGDADGHYKLDPAGAATPPNEIWPGDGPFIANPAGVANVNTTAGYTAGGSAVAVVVHDLTLPSTANKVACADLG